MGLAKPRKHVTQEPSYPGTETCVLGRWCAGWPEAEDFYRPSIVSVCFAATPIRPIRLGGARGDGMNIAPGEGIGGGAGRCRWCEGCIPFGTGWSEEVVCHFLKATPYIEG